MPKTKQQKQETLKKLSEMLEQSKSIVFSSFSDVNVSDQEELRSNLRESNVSYTVLKKTLIKKFLGDKGIEGSSIDEIYGNIAVAVSNDDETAPAKILMQASKGNENIKVCFGFLEGELIDESRVKALAALPTKDELIARVVGSIRAPLTGLVNVFQGNQRNLVSVLNQIRDNKN